MILSSVHGRYIIRFCVCAQDAQDSDIDYAWDVITDFAAELLETEMIKEKSGTITTAGQQEVAEKREFKVEISELMELMGRSAIKPNARLKRQLTMSFIPERTVSIEKEPEFVLNKKQKTKLSRKLSQRQFSFADSIKLECITDTTEETINP